MRQEADPVAILLVDPIPEGPQPRASREVREERGLAVAGVADHEHDAAVDLDVQPVQQPRPGERLVAECGRLDLPGLDRVAGHAIPCSTRTRADVAIIARPGPTATGARVSRVVLRGPMSSGSGGANDTDGSRELSMTGGDRGH